MASNVSGLGDRPADMRIARYVPIVETAVSVRRRAAMRKRAPIEDGLGARRPVTFAIRRDAPTPVARATAAIAQAIRGMAREAPPGTVANVMPMTTEERNAAIP